MVVSANYDLIPYPNHNYQVLTYVHGNMVERHDHGQESVERHIHFRRPHSDITSDAIDFDFCSNRYNAGQCLQYSDADQIGLLVDLYA